MASARFRLGTAATNSAGTSWSWRAYDTAVDVAAASYVKCELESTTGVGSVSYTITSADSTTLAAGKPTITTVQATKTATFRAATGVARCYLVRCQINSGQVANGDTASDYTKQVAVHRLASNGLRVLAVGETDEAHRTYGYEPKVNAVIRSVVASGSNYMAYTVATANASGDDPATFATVTTVTATVRRLAIRVEAINNGGTMLDHGSFDVSIANRTGSAAVTVHTILAMNNDLPGIVSYASTVGTTRLVIRSSGASAGRAVQWYCMISSYASALAEPPS